MSNVSLKAPMFKFNLKNVPRFFIAGLLATAVHYSVLFTLFNGFKLEIILSTSIGALCGAIVNYLINYFYTFGSQRKHAHAAGTFFLVAGTGLILNASIVGLMFHLLALPALPAQLSATLITFAWNYLAHQRWTF